MSRLQEFREKLEEARKKKVVRGGTVKKKIVCPKGQMSKNGKCVPIKSDEKRRFAKASRKRKRTIAGKSTAAASRKRKRSTRKRRSSGLNASFVEDFDLELTEELDVEEYMKDAEKAEKYLRDELNQMFRGQDVEVELVDGSEIGTKDAEMLVVKVYDVPSNGRAMERMNSRTKAEFSMELSDRMGRLIPKSKFHFEKDNIRGNVKYRRIMGKSPMDAAQKLVKWFKKNRDEFLMDPDMLRR